MNINSNSDENNIKYYSNDEGILSLMYHRFNESKYPSTNIQMDIFKNQINIIKDSNYNFLNPKDFKKEFNIPRKKKKILINIYNAFHSFYFKYKLYIKKNKIPFILFVSTETTNKKNYMSWDQIREVENEEFTIIGHHSHTHEYLVDGNND